MDQRQIEQIVGQLYLAIKDLQAQLEQMQARLAEKPVVSPLHAVPKDESA